MQGFIQLHIMQACDMVMLANLLTMVEQPKLLLQP